MREIHASRCADYFLKSSEESDIRRLAQSKTSGVVFREAISPSSSALVINLWHLTVSRVGRILGASFQNMRDLISSLARKACVLAIVGVSHCLVQADVRLP